jgi:anti-sigma-K factor RskA
VTTEPIPTGAQPDVTAAELALGVLEGEERAAALRRLVAEPAFAREVERWRDHFALLFAGVPGVVAPDGVFETVQARIGGGRGVTPIEPRGASNPWKPAALAASIAALLMTAVAFRPVEQVPPRAPAAVEAPLVAAMAPADKSEPHPAIYDASAGMVKMPGHMPIPAGRAAQLWAIQGDRAPIPLGTFRETGPGMYVAEAKMGAVIAPGTMLAISIEPIGGSPTGKPTGPVIASGMLTKV